LSDADKNLIELHESRAMVYLPENAVSVNITAKVWDGEKIVEAQKELTLQEIREAFDDAEENYIDPNDEFVLADFGKQMKNLKELEAME